MNERILVDNVTVSYRHYESASRSIKLNLLLNSKNRKIERTALNDITLKVNPGEILGVIGSNGAGKSTLVKTIVGTVRPLKGFVRTSGIVSAIIELSAGINMDMTPLDNVKLHSAIYNLDLKDAINRTEKICSWAGLSEQINDPIRTFSSGMIARFAFALNTDLKPDILILDEVLSVGDKNFQEKSLARTRELLSGGTAVILVSHDMNAIRNFCDQVLWLESGYVRMLGDATTVVAEYEKS